MAATDGHYKLRSCLWELTLRCNMRCLHCGSSAGRARVGELSLEECLAVVRELASLGCSELTLIGGEVFLYKGWERIARFASDRGLLVNIMTNARGLSAAKVRLIQDARLVNVGVSVDGMERTHTLIRRRRDAFRDVITALDLLRGARVPTAAITSLMELNFPDLDPLYEFLLAHGVGLWQIQLVNPMGHMAGRRDLILRPKRLPGLIEFIREKNCERRMTVVAADSVGYFHDDSEAYIRGRREPICCWEGCQAGISACFIDSVGDVKGCGAMYDDAFIEGNLRSRRLGEIWRDERCFRFNRAFDVGLLTGRCRGCEMADICKGGCRASNYFTTGSLYESAFCQRSSDLRQLGDPPCPSELLPSTSRTCSIGRAR